MLSLNPIMFIKGTLQHYKERYAKAKTKAIINWSEVSFLRKEIYNLQNSLKSYYN
jgi:hypothetical protein